MPPDSIEQAGPAHAGAVKRQLRLSSYLRLVSDGSLSPRRRIFDALVADLGQFLTRLIADPELLA